MIRIIQGDCRGVLPTMEPESVDCVITSPPYWLQRCYTDDPRELGLEATLDTYVQALVDVFRKAKTVLKKTGTLWLNLGDVYARSRHGSTGTKSALTNPKRYEESRVPALERKCGLPRKSLVGLPWRVAFALQDDGWILRSDIVWAKVTAVPESCRDRPTRSHEFVFLFAQKPRGYYYDAGAVREPSSTGSHPRGTGIHTKARVNGSGRENGKQNTSFSAAVKSLVPDRNLRDVWATVSRPIEDLHFAPFPPDIVRPCLLAGCPMGGTVLDPFAGTGTVGEVAAVHGRDAVLIELDPKSCAIMRRRFERRAPLLARIQP